MYHCKLNFLCTDTSTIEVRPHTMEPGRDRQASHYGEEGFWEAAECVTSLQVWSLTCGTLCRGVIQKPGYPRQD
jgi:hypothetical protein